jgi:large subunit ribosomal protein L9
MKVILTQAVQGLGEAGTIKEVADGYARNFLLPKGLAIVATRGSIKQAEAQADTYARKAEKAKGELQKTASAIQDKTVVIRARSGSENRLYGSVTAADVAEALAAQHNITIDRRRIEVETIHRLGTYQATVDLGNGVSTQFNVEVAPEVPGASGKAVRASGAPEGLPETQAEAESARQEAAAESTSVSETPAEQEAEANPS